MPSGKDNNMKSNEFTKALLEKCEKAFHYTHFLYGIDYEAPFGIAYVEGPYTVKKLMRTAQGFDPKDHVLVILTRRHVSEEFRPAVVKNGELDIELRKVSTFRCFFSGIIRFYTKKQFEDVRQSPTAETYLIWQEKRFLKLPEAEKKPTADGRYDVRQCYCHCDGPKEYLDSATLLDLFSSGEKMEFSPNRKDILIGDVIDKSGYIILFHREELEKKAAALRAERQRAAFLAGDYTGLVQELDRLVKEWKTKIVKDLAAAETSDDVLAVRSEISGFASVMSSLEVYRTNVEEKKFRSADVCEDDFKWIRDKATAWKSKCA